MKRVAWWATIHEVAKELDTTFQLTNNLFIHTHTHTHTHTQTDRQTETERQKQREADTEREIKTCSRKM